MRLISELKRRNVLRAAFAYAVVWWLVVQIAGLLLDAFSAPDWAFRSFIILLALGFPVALVLSWFFEITTDGLVRSDDLLTMLARIDSFRVTSRTSVMRYRDSDMSIPEISDKLGVDYVLEGDVQRDGDFIRVNAQLIDAERDEHL